VFFLGVATYVLGAIAIGVWVLYRVVRGWMRLSNGEPMYV
jgi:uncharacterized membrane protein